MVGVGPTFTLEFPTEAVEESSEPLMINIWEVLGLLVSFVLSILAGGAMIYAVARHFLGSAILVQRSYKYAWARFPKLLGVFVIAVLILIVPLILSLFIVGIPLLVFGIVVLLFATHAVAIEQMAPTDAVKRSWNVVQGNWWRSCGLLLGITLAFMGAALIIFLPAGIFLPAVLVAMLSAAFSAVVTPLATIAITALYFDIRVRKEQYTHNDLARELGEIPRM